MKIKNIELNGFKRFSKTKIIDIPENSKLIILIGPNGSGKTSLFEAFKQFSSRHGGIRHNSDNLYLSKFSERDNFNQNWNQSIKIEFHDRQPSGIEEYKKLFYIRTAYRNESDFTANGLGQLGSFLDNPRFNSLIENDATISDNYQRIVATSVNTLFDSKSDTMSGKEIREEVFGELRDSIARVFPDLILSSVGNPTNDGTFYFNKGAVNNFRFKNLSAGEKAAFDLILDILTKKQVYNETIYCIDEPDTHLHSKLQGLVLEELYNLIPENCQLVISTHSIGMIRKAVEMSQKHTDKICFLDFHNKNQDDEIIIKPTKITRDLWREILNVAIDDLSTLISPKRLVICEGRPINLSGRNLEFDASILRKIFNENYVDTDFISVGNEHSVKSERIDIISAINSLKLNVEFIKIIDRDSKTNEEIEEYKKKDGVKVLSKRDIENYLFDDEIILKLCKKYSQDSLYEVFIKIKNDLISKSVSNHHFSDDIKVIAGDLFINIVKILNLQQAGSNKEAFMKDILAPLITPETNTYKILENDIFK